MEAGACDLLEYCKYKHIIKDKLRKEELQYIFYGIVLIMYELNKNGLYY
jgi:hypothetical protein